MAPGALVYDADCAFCTRFAAWSGPAVPSQELDIDAAGATLTEVTTAAGWLVDGEVVAWGAPAIAAALIQRGGPARAAGRVLRLPVVRLAADLVYRLVARNRHLMPGGTAACRVESRGPSRALLGAAMVAILLAGLVSLAASNRGSEPYPSLLMPGFGPVPELGGSVGSTEVTYTLVMADGSTRSVAADQLLRGHSGYVAALRTLSDPAAARDPETVAWLRANLGPAAADAVELRADWHRVTYDTGTRERRDEGIQRTVTVDLEANR